MSAVRAALAAREGRRHLLAVPGRVRGRGVALAAREVAPVTSWHRGTDSERGHDLRGTALAVNPSAPLRVLWPQPFFPIAKAGVLLACKSVRTHTRIHTHEVRNMPKPRDPVTSPRAPLT